MVNFRSCTQAHGHVRHGVLAPSLTLSLSMLCGGCSCNLLRVIGKLRMDDVVCGGGDPADAAAHGMPLLHHQTMATSTVVRPCRRRISHISRRSLAQEQGTSSTSCTIMASLPPDCGTLGASCANLSSRVAQANGEAAATTHIQHIPPRPPRTRLAANTAPDRVSQFC